MFVILSRQVRPCKSEDVTYTILHVKVSTDHGDFMMSEALGRQRICRFLTQ